MLNQVIIMGRMVADPQIRQTNNGVAVCSFRIACDRDGQITEGGQKADFVDCVAWRKTAEFVAKYFAKGKPILIDGRLQIRPWVDKDGNKRNSTEILVNAAHFCGGDKVNNQAAGAPVPPPMPGVGVVPDFNELGGDEDLPWEDHDMQ